MAQELFDILAPRLKFAILQRNEENISKNIKEMEKWGIFKLYTADCMKTTIMCFKNDKDRAFAFCKRLMPLVDPVVLLPASYAAENRHLFRNVANAYIATLTAEQLKDIITALMKIEPSTNDYWWFVDNFSCAGAAHHTAFADAFPKLKGVAFEYDNKNKVFVNMFTGEVIYKL